MSRRFHARRRTRQEVRWTIVKDYYTENGDNCTDTWCIIYDSAAEATAAMERLNAGQDKTWYDPAGSGFLYVTDIVIDIDT